MKTITFLSLLIVLQSPSVFACSVCFYGSPDNSANIALRMGVVSLLVILLGVLLAFAKFFLSIRKRTKLLTPNH